MLPWFAAGTLSRQDAARVEAALKNDPVLAQRFELVREELGETIRLNEDLGAPSSRAMKSLFAKIDAEAPRQPGVSFNLVGRISEFRREPVAAHAGLCRGAAALAILLQAGVLTSLIMQNPNIYGVSSVPQGEENTRSVDLGSSAHVLIRFNPQASVADISKFLAEHNASIAGGPAAGSGLFRLKVAEKPVSQAELAAIVKRMQGNPVVGFTVPAAQ